MNVPRTEKDYKTLCLEIIEEYKKKLEKIISDETEERKERYHKVLTKLDEIENLEDRMFVIISFVSELYKTKKVLESLLKAEE